MSELNLFLSSILLLIIFNMVFIAFICRSKQKYGAKKFVFSIALIVFWLLFEAVKYSTDDPDVYYRSLIFSNLVCFWLCWFGAMSFYEFAKLRKIQTNIFCLLMIPLLLFTIFSIVPSLNYLITTYKANHYPFYMSSYNYTWYFDLIEAFCYVCGLIGILSFYLLERDSSAKFKKSYIIILITVSIGGIQFFLKLHGFIDSSFNLSPLLFSLSFATMYLILGSYTYNNLHKPVMETITDEMNNLTLAYDKKNIIFFVNNTLIDMFYDETKISKHLTFGLNIYDKDKCLKLFPLNFYLQICSKDYNNEALFEYKGQFFKKTITINNQMKSNEIYILNFANITSSIEHTKKLTERANIDSLTQLRNRFAFENDIKNLNFQMSNLIFAIIDLDNLKLTNDILGHTKGDEYIEHLVINLKKHFSAKELYRVGGDEFYILVYNQSLADFQDKINQLYQEASLDKISLQFSIGCSLKNENFKSLNELIKFTDNLMYISKNKGKNMATYYSDDYFADYMEKENLKYDFLRGMKEKEITFFLQPKYNLLNNEVDSAEALVRWEHKDLGIISPYKFLDIAKSLKLISDMDFVILDKACQELQRWQENYSRQINISVNLSLESILKPTLVKDIISIVDRYNIEHSLITLEILEDQKLGDFLVIQKILAELKKEGFLFAIDDFGSGFSNFDTLNNLSVDEIKIDKLLIDKIGIDSKQNQSIALLCEMLSIYNCRIIAEGVETKEQLDEIKNITSITHIQGYYFSKPLPVIEFVDKYIKP